MKIAFVIQRYGTEILGGSEYHCRLIAERMAVRHQVDVLTTCAREYTTWKNEYPEGSDRIRGVNVRRFPNTRTRDLEAFNTLSDWIFNYPHTREDELRWLEEQGPWSPALLEYLQRSHQQYDVLIFFTYLYAPTVLGMQIAPRKSILVPTAHDEPAAKGGGHAIGTGNMCHDRATPCAPGSVTGLVAGVITATGASRLEPRNRPVQAV